MAVVAGTVSTIGRAPTVTLMAGGHRISHGAAGRRGTEVIHAG
jgi:hypothetical protein